MKLKQRFGIGLVCLMFSMGCSDEVRLNDDTKKWLLESNPPEIVSEDLSKVSRNNDIYKEVCEEHKSMADKMKAKATRVIDKTLMATEE